MHNDVFEGSQARREGKNFQMTDYLKNMENASQSGGISRY